MFRFAIPLFLLVFIPVPFEWMAGEEPPNWLQPLEIWTLPVQLIVCGALLLRWCRFFPFDRPQGSTLAVGALVGLVGIAIWILPVAAGWQERLEGFNPKEYQDQPLLFAILLTVRFLKLVVLVSFVEEIFWRAGLMRLLVDFDRYEEVPFGSFSWRSYLLTSLFVALIHKPADYGVALVWALLIGGLAIKTKSLWACVVAHAVANLVLGIYILTSENWGLW